MHNFFPVILLAIYFITSVTTHAEVITIIKKYSYQASDDDSKTTSRNNALATIKRMLLEELGTYVESETEVKNSALEKDQIKSLTAGVVRTEIINEKWDGRLYYLKAKLSADPEEVAKSIKKLLARKRNSDGRPDTYLINKNDNEYKDTQSPFACGELTVKDKNTGLIWLKNGRISSRNNNLNENMRLIEKLNKDVYGGYKGWRLPTVDEFQKIGKYAIDTGYSGNYNSKGKVFEYMNSNCFIKVEERLYATSTYDRLDEDKNMSLTPEAEVSGPGSHTAGQG